jgi:hypothetical protein
VVAHEHVQNRAFRTSSRWTVESVAGIFHMRNHTDRDMLRSLLVLLLAASDPTPAWNAATTGPRALSM